jgi:acetyl esterase/lipase
MVGGTRTPVNNAPNRPTLDVFPDEDIEYARRLLGAGVPTEIHVYPGVFHGSDIFVPKLASSRRFIADRDAALKRTL